MPGSLFKAFMECVHYHYQLGKGQSLQSKLYKQREQLLPSKLQQLFLDTFSSRVGSFTTSEVFEWYRTYRAKVSGLPLEEIHPDRTMVNRLILTPLRQRKKIILLAKGLWALQGASSIPLSQDVSPNFEGLTEEEEEGKLPERDEWDLYIQQKLGNN